MKATLVIENAGGLPPGTNIYAIDRHLYGFDHLAVCAHQAYNQSFIVGCTAEGRVETEHMMGIYHSEYVPHATALAACGYEEVGP